MKIVHVLGFLAIAARAYGECAEGCDQPVHFYAGLGCQPIYAAADDCCPAKFDCSHIEERAAKKGDACYFHGKTYAIDESVEDDVVYENCRVGCFCDNPRNDTTREFVCAIVECLPSYDPDKPECYGKYRHGECCPYDDACPPFAVTCEIGDETYHEGQRVPAPHKKCFDCICDEGFVGELELPHCKRIACIDEIDHQEEVHNFCAPVYHDATDVCCPTYWLCPDGNEIVESAESPSANDPGLSCKFGARPLEVGDRFVKERDVGGRIACECRIPPYVTCVRETE